MFHTLVVSVRVLALIVLVFILMLGLESSLLQRLFRRVVDFDTPSSSGRQDSCRVDLIELVLRNKTR